MSVEDSRPAGAADGEHAAAALTEAARAADWPTQNGAAPHAAAPAPGSPGTSAPDTSPGRSATGDAATDRAAPPEATGTSTAASCKRCGADVATSTTWERFRVCKACGYHAPLPARRRLELLLDGGVQLGGARRGRELDASA